MWASKTEVKRTFETKRWRFRYTRRGTEGVMGRFGGGWQWKIGAQWTGTDIIVSLLVSELRIQRKKDV